MTVGFQVLEDDRIKEQLAKYKDIACKKGAPQLT